MKKRILHTDMIYKMVAVIAVAILLSFGTNAENVSQKQASKIAATFFNAAYGEYVSAPKLVWNGKKLTTNRLFSPFYVYNHPKGGFVVIPADNKAFPILAYSTKVNFNPDVIGEDEMALFRQYAREIELIRYDDRWPAHAVAAWQDINLSISNALTSPYTTPEYESITDERKAQIEEIDRRNSWIVMPTAVEFPLYDPSMYREYTLEDVLGEEVAEEVPFSFYENFIREIYEEERQRLAALDEIVHPTQPILHRLGGAHYTITLPEEARMIRVYGVDGSSKIEKTYSGVSDISMDLSSLPVGYYVVMALTREGHIYGFKVAR